MSKPLLTLTASTLEEKIIAHVEVLGYRRVPDTELWTHPDWRDYYRNPNTGETSDRMATLDQLARYVMLVEAK